MEAFRSFPQVSTSTIERHADSVSEPDLQSEAGGDRSEMEILGVFPTVEDLQQVAEHPAEDEPSKDTDQVFFLPFSFFFFLFLSLSLSPLFWVG